MEVCSYTSMKILYSSCGQWFRLNVTLPMGFLLHSHDIIHSPLNTLRFQTQTKYLPNLGIFHHLTHSDSSSIHGLTIPNIILQIPILVIVHIYQEREYCWDFQRWLFTYSSYSTSLCRCSIRGLALVIVSAWKSKAKIFQKTFFLFRANLAKRKDTPNPQPQTFDLVIVSVWEVKTRYT